ncbi:hypothetical protein MCP_2573 [Methanocella paludicola SANAE]|uniref:Uncharacterized protein n=1 Tax=Methanocella paludicola (strain DSM 17711 / JCM 13418 / NBRC 101707 / SANAE) TaxID=304371 RepID=D1Z1S3_METPS|nr:hypothetical protein [Methanocella paludicola]BAI62645.1 hypothetical protein MCP_2573 [Methanocella paludicola SANAE]
MSDDLAAWHSSLEKGISEVFPGIGKVIVSSGGRSYPEDIGWLAERMSRLRASEMLIEEEEGSVLVVKDDYGDMAVAVKFSANISPVSLSRSIRLTFARREARTCIRPYVPAADVDRLVRSWKSMIALIFGENFASKLVEKSFRGRARDEMTPEEVEAARAFISSALGDCLALDKVNK